MGTHIKMATIACLEVLDDSDLMWVLLHDYQNSIDEFAVIVR